MITAAQARAVSDLARVHSERLEDAREQNRMEMQKLQDSFGWRDPAGALLAQLPRASKG
ncbi:hypothetical protein [Luteimonas terrae]|uniref:Uncharacterized protein n=1 Tax=Luteimonas terrae TaxID=1530191 RepID=A0ABU1XX70_9GAMM|nr:hypothetical protein [Luteimonas terrae]MDR7193360.1 hypothetical protein [Luteimonas terrae]